MKTSKEPYVMRPQTGFDRHASQPALNMTDEEVDQMISTFAEQDAARQKTWSRLVVENYLSKWRWYFPRAGDSRAPSLSKAYAYYEHITLPRRVVSDASASHVMRRAVPGETQATELYSPFKTRSSTLIEWGVGVDLYFTTLFLMAILLLCAGLIHLPNIMFYNSNEYSPAGKVRVVDNRTEPIFFSLASSAICSTADWVVCADCTEEQWIYSPERFAKTADGVVLVARNGCEGGQFSQGVVNYVVAFLLAGAMALVSLYLRAREVRFEEDKITASDYTVVVRNPPPDAYDPDDWRDFFSQFADKQVTGVTIALDNHVLVRKLVERRVYMSNLRLALPKGVPLDDETAVRGAVGQIVLESQSERQGCLVRVFGCLVLPFLNFFNMLLPVEKLADKVFTLRDEIEVLLKKKYDVTSVFVTFETEEGQRAALSAMSTGKLTAMMNKTSAVTPSIVFQDRVLRVREPTEPSSVRWHDLGSSTMRKVAGRALNFCITLLLVSAAGWIVAAIRRKQPWITGPAVSVFNSVIPLIIKILMVFERHTSEGSYQSSLYLKITLFRWVNTAVLTKFITPFTSTVAPGRLDVLPQINSILWSELWLVPALRLLDLWGNIQKHFFAPRCRTQETMNSFFQGTYYNLGERYTDMTKILFVCFFYSSLFPTTFFFGFAILIVQYCADKYCLMRIWGWNPELGSELASFSRRYFFSGAVVAYFLVSAYAWAQFPYDNVCDSVNSTYVAPATYVNILAPPNVPSLQSITVTQEAAVVFCSQSWRSYDGFSFPPTPRLQPEGLTWMRGTQEALTILYGWTACIVAALFIVFFFGTGIVNFSLSWVRGVYEAANQNQHIDFSSNDGINLYIPQIRSFGLPFPLLACDVDCIDDNLIGWSDPVHSFDYHNIIYDIPWDGMPRQRVEVQLSGPSSPTMTRPATPEKPLSDFKVPIKPVFSMVKYYPPVWKTKLEQH
ncbi:hypothetical protein MPSEU_000522100 [Mayamaea pseudoterrestris]|nr:hypothetical protein MPSEU_000522100 [Mayamaea pseudoterrestris]